MHLQRAISNFAILIVGSLTSLVAFLSTRLDQVVFYALAAGCLVLLAVMVSSARTRLSRYFPSLLGKSTVPRWNLSMRAKTLRRQTLIPTQPQRANVA